MPEPLTDDEKLQIMLEVSGSMMRYDIQRLLDGEIVMKNMARVWTKQDYLAQHWPNIIQHEPLYRHKKGGVYLKTGEATAVNACYSMVSGFADQIREQKVVIYEHIWPHARKLYVRPKAEFKEPGRFVRITA